MDFADEAQTRSENLLAQQLGEPPDAHDSFFGGVPIL